MRSKTLYAMFMSDVPVHPFFNCASEARVWSNHQKR